MATFITFIGDCPRLLLDEVIMFDADNLIKLKQEAQEIFASIQKPIFYGEVYDVESGVRVVHFVKFPEQTQ